MSRIQVTPERLFEAAREVEDAREQMEDTREELVRLIRWMESMWSGMVRERFLERFEENQPRMIDTLENLAHVAKELREIGVRFQQADEVSGAAVAGNVATKSIGLKATSTTKGFEDKNQVGLQGYDASCVPPPPDACRTPVADTRNVFQKSLDSLLELGTAFMQSADDRYQKRYDSVGGFLDYWTFGIPSGLVEEYVDRANKAFDSPNDTANWLTFGIHGTIRESIFPANAWSSEHWANMMGLGGMMVGGGITAKMIKPHNLLTSSGGGIKLDASSRPPGSGPMAGGFNGFKDPRLQVMDNIAESKKARESSKFSEFVEKEKRMVEGTSEPVRRYFRETTQADRELVESLRKKYTAGKKRNVAAAKGKIDGDEIDLESVSGEFTDNDYVNKGNFKPPQPEDYHYQGPISEFTSHTEQKVVEYLRLKYKEKPDVKGKIEIISERPYCDNCIDLVDQFQKEFPNIELVRVEVIPK